MSSKLNVLTHMQHETENYVSNDSLFYRDHNNQVVQFKPCTEGKKLIRALPNQSVFSLLRSARKSSPINSVELSLPMPSSNSSKVLLFKNIMNSEFKELNQWYNQGSLYLISALKHANIPVLISNTKVAVHQDDKEFATELAYLEHILKTNPDINIIGISLFESYFEQAQQLVSWLRERTDAYIAIGGIMPTHTPEHVLGHLKGTNIIVRGAGEKILVSIAQILNGKKRTDTLGYEQEQQLLSLQGLLFYDEKILIASDLEYLNNINNLDTSKLDFSVLNKEDVLSGLNLSSSRGCPNTCLFCTTIGKTRYHAKSFSDLVGILDSYERRLKQLFNEKVPLSCYAISFNDDDFLGDKERSKQFLEYIKTSPFKIDFFQCGILSFYIRENGKPTQHIDWELMNLMDPSIFYEGSQTWIYFGTENYTDEELRRHNKGYTHERIETITSELNKRKIKHKHHFIVTNIDTTPENIIENIARILYLKLHYTYFSILTPVIKNLVSHYPSNTYKASVIKNRLNHIIPRKVLTDSAFPEYTYPLIKEDMPLSKVVIGLSNYIEKALGYKEISVPLLIQVLEQSLMYVLTAAEKYSLSEDPQKREEAKRLYAVIENYHTIFDDLLIDLTPEQQQMYDAIFFKRKTNIQIMITRQCHLRCTYCPVDKNDQDMSEETIYKSVDFLMQHPSKKVRLDFLGGEPFMRFDLIKKAMKYAEEKAQKHHKEISFFAITNGIGLTEEVAQEISKHDFLIEMSIDGDEISHNKSKIPLDRSINPYRTLVAHSKYLQQYSIKNYAILVVTPKTVDVMLESFNHILSLGITTIDINYAFGLTWKEDEMNAFISGLKNIISTHERQIHEGKIRIGNLYGRIEPAILNSEIMINTKGTIHYLSEWIFETSKQGDFNVGNIASTSFSDVRFSKFTSQYKVYQRYTSKDERIRAILVNNIDFGNKVKRELAPIKRTFKDLR